MTRRIFNFELEARQVLCFDTGLTSGAFARAKMFQLLAQSGFIVYPDGKIETWQPEGVVELSSGNAMTLWGPFFPAERLIDIVNSDNKDAALDAVRFWLKARMLLEVNPAPGMELQANSPDGALIETGRREPREGEVSFPPGTVFFPPIRLLRRCLEAETTLLEAERWVHPDLQGAEGISFVSGAMLYRIFCGVPPFTAAGEAELRQDIRESVFIPPNMAAPGLDPEISELISGALNQKHGSSEINKRQPVSPAPLPDLICDSIGPPASRRVSSWIRSLNEEEISRIALEKEKYGKKRALAVKTRRFIVHNTVIITVSLVAVVLFAVFLRSLIRHRAELPTTLGMNPVEVAEAYYGAFGELDHTLMEACVSGKAGKGDIQMVQNLFVITRVRQAYEHSPDLFIPAVKWIEGGSKTTDGIVFGVTDLKLSAFSDSGEKASLTADYILWSTGAYVEDPGISSGNEKEEYGPELPMGLVLRDRVDFVFARGAWRITNIERIHLQ